MQPDPATGEPYGDEPQPPQASKRRRGGLSSLLPAAFNKITETFGGPEDGDI